MKHLKLILISGLVFFVLFTFIGLLFPSSVNTIKAVVVNKPATQVLQQLKINESWKNWHPFFISGINTGVKQTGADTTAFYNNKKWLLLYNKKSDSNTVSFTVQSFTGVVSQQAIAALPVAAGPGQTQVMWKETEHLKWYPWERFRGLLLERTKGDYLDSTLNRFKNYIEALP